MSDLVCDNLIKMNGIKVNGCDMDDPCPEKTPNVIDLDKNRIVLKRRRLKLWTRPLSNIFKNPFGNLSSNVHILGPRSPKGSGGSINNNNVAKPEVKIDIALIKKLEDEIYKRENNIRNGNGNNKRESYDSNSGFRIGVEDDDDHDNVLFGDDDGGEARFVFKNDTSAFKRGNKPVLLLDTRKLDPLLLKKTEIGDNITTKQPVYQNIDEVRHCIEVCDDEEGVPGTKNPTKSIIIVDNSNFYPILMRYDINNEVIESLNGNVEKCYKHFEMTKALKTETAETTSSVEQHKNNGLYLDVDPSKVTLDFPIESDVNAPKNSVLYHRSSSKCNSGGDLNPMNLRKRRHVPERPNLTCHDDFLELFNRQPLLRILTEDDCDYFLANLKTKISPQLCQQLSEMFGSKNYRSRLKFMIYKKLYRHFQTIKSTIRKRHHHHHPKVRSRNNTGKLSKSSSLPNVIDEDVLHKFCDNWKNYCHNTATKTTTHLPSQLLNWSTPDLINDRIYIADCAKTTSAFMTPTTPSNNTHVVIIQNNRSSLSTEGNSTLSTNVDSTSSSSASRNSNRSQSSSSNRQSVGSSVNNKNGNETGNAFIRKLHPIRQRASFRLKRHSVGSTDVVKTWVYRRRYIYIIISALFHLF